jgi:hypothetical protein
MLDPMVGLTLPKRDYRMAAAQTASRGDVTGRSYPRLGSGLYPVVHLHNHYHRPCHGHGSIGIHTNKNCSILYRTCTVGIARYGTRARFKFPWWTVTVPVTLILESFTYLT